MVVTIIIEIIIIIHLMAHMTGITMGITIIQITIEDFTGDNYVAFRKLGRTGYTKE